MELLGTPGTLADAEILRLLLSCVSTLQLADWRLIVGNAGLTRSLLEIFPEAVRDPVRGAIARLDRITLETLALPDDLCQRALQMMDLRGRPQDVLQTVSQLSLTVEQKNTVNELKSLVELLESDHQPPLILDLSWFLSSDYYTVVVLEAAPDTSQGRHLVGRGRRNDNITRLFDTEGHIRPV